MYVRLTCCQLEDRVSCDVAVPTSVVPAYSRKRSFTTEPGESARAHIDAVYVPAVVVFTQFGESFSRQVPTLAVVALETCADQLPVCPPLVRVRVEGLLGRRP